MAAEIFRDKVAVITGASSGIGKAIAHELPNEGAWLAIASRDARRLDAVAEECAKKGGKAISVPTNVADEEQCRRLIRRCIDTFGRIDMIINNAGIDVVCKLEELPDLHLFKQVMAVNFNGTVYCTYYSLPYLKESKGRIVNVSSLGGIIAIPYNTSYVASKFAINGFSDSLRMEVVSSGISVTLICPYWVITEFHERYLDKNGKPKGPSGRRIYTSNMMTAEKCASIVLNAARTRKREVLLGSGKFARALRIMMPGTVDKLTIKRVTRRVAERIADADEDGRK